MTDQQPDYGQQHSGRPNDSGQQPAASPVPGGEPAKERPDPAEALQNPAERLVRASVERSGRDNTTAVVVEVV